MRSIKHYKLVELLGSGGMGEVYRAFDSMLQRDVAIKVMHRHLWDDERTDQRFVHEARAVARLSNRNIVTVYEVGKAKMGRYIVMEYVRGRAFAELISPDAFESPERIIKLAVQILDGLASAHNVGLIHRDIKPDNILITETDVAKILDFGIAKLMAKEGLTAAGDILGTVEYMAPEQMLGDPLDSRCDIYATGVVLYQVLTKRFPFDAANPVAILYKILNEDPVPPSHYHKDVSPRLDEIILKSIHQDREKRWQTADDFASALGDVLKEREHSERQTSPTGNQLSFPVELDAAGPGAVEKAPRQVFVGREDEFKQMVGWFSDASRGHGHTVMLKGEAGVGKSALAHRLRDYAELNQAWIFYGACLYQEGMEAFLPYLDAVRRLFGNKSAASPEERKKLKKLSKAEIHRLGEFPSFFKESFGGDFSTALSERGINTEELFEILYRLINLTATIRPTLVIIDDLHVADESSLRLFHYLSHHVSNSRMLLIGICRTERYDLLSDGKPNMVVEMLGRISREAGSEEVALGKLGKESCSRLVDKAMLPSLFTDEFYDLLFRETKGNPLFATETLKLLVDQGVIFLKDGTWYNKQENFNLPVPEQVKDAFLRRVSALGDDEKEILQFASAMGNNFDPGQLAHLLELTRMKLLRVLQRVETELQILRSNEQGFCFEHPMLREILYDEIPIVLRTEYHLMIAGEMERIYGDDFGAQVGEVAGHFRRAGQHEKALPLLYKAALRAFKLGAYREAGLLIVDYLDSAKQTGQAERESMSNMSLYQKLGRCYEETGRWTESLDAYHLLYELSKKQNDVNGQIEALERLGRIQVKLGDHDTALETYHECLALVEQSDAKDVLPRIYNCLGIIHRRNGDFDRAKQYFEQTIELAETEGNDYRKANALLNLGLLTTMRADYTSALACYEKALKIYVLLGDIRNQVRVYNNIGLTYLDQSDWPRCRETFERCLELLTQVEDKQLQGVIYLNIGRSYAEQGGFSEAKKCTEKALKLFKLMGESQGVAEAYHVLAMIHLGRENYSEAELFLKESLALNVQKADKQALAANHELYGSLCTQQGYPERAGKHYQEALSAYEELHLELPVSKVKSKIDELGIEQSTESDVIKVVDADLAPTTKKRHRKTTKTRGV